MAYSVDIYDKNGKVVSKVSLNESIFNDDLVNNSLIHEYYLLQIGNARTNIAKVKGKGEVHGSGKKLYKQKGTGSARVGGKQSPVRRGGGVAFGPTGVKNFSKNMTKKARKLALNGILSLKAKDNEICGLNEIDFVVPKTKEAGELLNKIGLKNKKVLFVVDKDNVNLKKSFRNLIKVKYLLVDYLNPYDLMYADKVVFMEEALKKINK